MLTETEKAYLAGFFDGEGCVNISTRNRANGARQHYLQVVFSQGDYDFLMDWREKLNGAGSVHEDKAEKKIPMSQRSWHWRLYDRQAERVLYLMLPYLQLKVKQVQIAVLFMATKKRYGRAGVPAHILDKRDEYQEALRQEKAGLPIEPKED